LNILTSTTQLRAAEDPGNGCKTSIWNFLNNTKLFIESAPHSSNHCQKRTWLWRYETNGL